MDIVTINHEINVSVEGLQGEFSIVPTTKGEQIRTIRAAMPINWSSFAVDPEASMDFTINLSFDRSNQSWRWNQSWTFTPIPLIDAQVTQWADAAFAQAKQFVGTDNTIIAAFCGQSGNGKSVALGVLTGKRVKVSENDDVGTEKTLAYSLSEKRHALILDSPGLIDFDPRANPTVATQYMIRAFNQGLIWKADIGRVDAKAVISAMESGSLNERIVDRARPHIIQYSLDARSFENEITSLITDKNFRDQEFDRLTTRQKDIKRDRIRDYCIVITINWLQTLQVIKDKRERCEQRLLRYSTPPKNAQIKMTKDLKAGKAVDDSKTTARAVKIVEEYFTYLFGVPCIAVNFSTESRGNANATERM
jgi:hypothetical protein